MKWVSFVVCNLCALTLGSVQVKVCDPNSLEAFDASEIMMGTTVAIVVSSDINDLWSGGLFIEGDDRSTGTLTARGKDPNSRDWTESHLPAAGPGAQVLEWRDSVRWGFDLYTDDLERQAGSFFVIDYTPLHPGDCTVNFYDHSESWIAPDPNNSISFINTPSRDLVRDGIINYADFALFSLHWQKYSGTDPNLFSPADLSSDGYVDVLDLCMFADFWMYGLPGWQPKQKTPIEPEPDPEPQPEPTITYTIADSEMLSEITLQTGQSITLYIYKESQFPEPSVIDLETVISDPNLGWIDNTPIDPNNPPGPGTARILFTPRETFFDYWGPGITQREGIEFVAATFSGSIANGALASFVYTAASEGTVVLELCDYASVSNTQSITIHQVADTQNMSASYQPELLMMPSAMEASMVSEPLSYSDFNSAQTTESADPEELADFLEQIWETDEGLRVAIDEASWNEFIENVRNSEY